SIRVLPGRRDRRTLPYGSFPAKSWYLPRVFVRGPDRVANDWGLIVLREPVTRITQFIPMHAASDAELAWLSKHGKVSVAGYPSDRPGGHGWGSQSHFRGVQ